jgi:hypothetical protein
LIPEETYLNASARPVLRHPHIPAAGGG